MYSFFFLSFFGDVPEKRVGVYMMHLLKEYFFLWLTNITLRTRDRLIHECIGFHRGEGNEIKDKNVRIDEK